jgi:hypothetical protein
MRSTLLALLLVPVLLLLAACQSGPPGTAMFDGGGDYKEVGVQAHPALLRGVDIVWWARGMGPSREKVGVLRGEDGKEVRPGGLQELATYCEPIDSPRAARNFGHLARLLHTPGLPVDGDPIDPDPSISGKGGNGKYSRADAAAWGIEFEPASIASGGGWEMQRVILVAPWTHPDLKYQSPWRLVWVRGIVYPDGAVTVLDERTLTNGDDAQRFVRF